MFTSVSSYEEEFETSVENMSSMIEPIMIVFGNHDWWFNDSYIHQYLMLVQLSISS